MIRSFGTKIANHFEKGILQPIWRVATIFEEMHPTPKIMRKNYAKVHKKIFIPIFFLFILFLLHTHFSLAQQKILGNVIDDNDKPLENVMISINGSSYVSSNKIGNFELPITNNTAINDVKAVKKGYKIKNWYQKPNGITIILQPSTQFTGVVVKGNDYLPNAEVLVGDLKTFTDVSGNFKIEIPLNMLINENTTFTVNGNLIPKDQISFKNNYGSVTLRLPVPKSEETTKQTNTPQKSKKVTGVVLYNAQKQPLANTKIRINGVNYKSDFLGKITLEKPIEVVQVQAIVQGKELFKKEVIGDFLVLSFVEQKQITPNEAVYASEIGNITDNLLEQGALQEQRSKKLQADLDLLTERLRNDKTLTNQQRQVLLAYAQQLEKTFLENDKNYQALQTQSKQRIEQMTAVILKKDSIQSVTEERLEVIKSEKEALKVEKELAALRSRTNIIILSLVALAFLLVALTFFIANNRIRKQKRLLEEAKDELSQKIEQINLQNQEIIQQNRDIEEKNLALQTAYSQIRSSVISAQRIQSSILPNHTPLEQYFADTFILYVPRDIVSGDFYWYAQKGDEMIIAAIDCTGHGVPGAFMTMLANSLLNQIVNENGITQPAEILSILDQKVQATLHQKEESSTSSEGMDMVLLKFDKRQRKVCFAGAKTPLFYVQNHTIHMIKGSNVPIGNTRIEIERIFDEHEIDFEEGMIFYLASDGFQDQFGGQGSRPKKYMKAKFKDLLLQHHHKPLREQQAIILEAHNQWKGDGSQTDDIIILGLKI